MFRNRLTVFVALILLSTLAAGAQQLQPPQTPPAPGGEQTFTITVNSQLVVDTVIVNDKDGKPIHGLTKDDFTVTEDNVPQTISVFEYQKLDDTPVQLSDGGTIPKATVEAVKPAQLTPPPAGDARYDNRRLLVLFFDL